MTEMELRNRISKISDEETLEAVSYVANWMEDQARMDGKLAATEAIPDDRSAIEILCSVLPELADSLKEIYDNDHNAKIARNVLLFMAEQDSYAAKVEEAIDRPALRGEPFTVGLSTIILLLLVLEFDLKYTDKKSGKSLYLSKKSQIMELLMKILGH
jgi:hypothetical protein